MSHDLNLLLPCASHGHPELQTLNKFVEQHSFEGGDFFLGAEYSYAEVAATPFFHRASIALPEYRGYSIETALQQHSLTRLQSWFKVNVCHRCMLFLSSCELLTCLEENCQHCCTHRDKVAAQPFQGCQPGATTYMVVMSNERMFAIDEDYSIVAWCKAGRGDVKPCNSRNLTCLQVVPSSYMVHHVNGGLAG